MYVGLILKSQHVENLKPKCVIKENYIPPSSKFSAIFSSVLREKMPNFDLVSGDHATEVAITATIISTGMPVFLDTAKYGWEGGEVTAGDRVQQSARTLKQITGNVVKRTQKQAPLPSET